MHIGTRTKVLLGFVAALIALGYLIVVDLGIHAGRIHRGVRVEGGVSVGGLSLVEAAEKLEGIGEALESEPLVFLTEGFDCRFTPDELGFRARPFSTAKQAMRVGRDDAPFGALKDRVRAWLGGVTVEWTGNPNTKSVGRFVKQCEELGFSFGVDVNRPRLRFLVKKAMVEWPREQTHEIPLE
jgi:hypothetical protein